MEYTNPVATQSREWIMSTLIELMKEKGYSNIKVSDIVNKAMLARKTFYRHFETKEDVLMAHFIELTNFLIERLSQLEEFDTIKALTIIFQLVKENEEFFKLLYHHNLIMLLFNYWNSELIKEYDLTPSAFDKWVRQAKTTGSFKSVDNMTDEHRELIALRKRNRELEMQLDILKQAAVIMAQKEK